jgi:hypothetical protein
MFTFTDDERASMRGTTQDPQGRTVLFGLTFEEYGRLYHLPKKVPHSGA